MSNVFKTSILIITQLLLVISFYAQNNSENLNNKIENFIISKQIDSVKSYISKQTQKSYGKLLNRIVQNKASNSDYFQFISNIYNRTDLNYQDVSNYINTTIKASVNLKEIDYDFVKIKWLQISKLRDEINMAEANKEQSKLERYVNKFNDKDINVVKSKLLISIHEIVLYQIQNDVENGKSLCLKSLETAKKLEDKELIIAFLYHLCDFYVIEGELDKYIKTSEESLDIENDLKPKSSYYVGTLIHLIDAYVYKGDNSNRVEELLAELYGNEHTRILSYSLYAKYLGTLSIDSSIKESIFNQFKVSNIVEFCEKIEKLSEERLNPNDFFHVLNESANTLAKLDFFEKSIYYKDKCVTLTRKIYSEDLSNALANFKTQQAVKSKELELKHEKETTDLYIVIITLVSIVLLASILFIRRIGKQSKILKIKNNQINKTLKEKELLVKEVHHRVKNNFQIVSSLLELQAQGINDEKALEFIVDSKNRVNSMALIHQKLYNNDKNSVNFKDYVKHLILGLSAFDDTNKKVKIDTDIDEVFFDVDTATPLGLIINELIINAYKHAFKGKSEGYLLVSIKRIDNENYKLLVHDNGHGVTNEEDIDKIKKFGLHLVLRLVKQLQGSLKFENDNGLKISIVFKDINARKKID
ncbi:sensor histidine kinase [uncultured Wocania sp.]|uniref:sensor histidine kinase n=1 Tax=uncultured Wocania sp. TaxID=2834404 RepID=UPI0030F83B36